MGVVVTGLSRDLYPFTHICFQKLAHTHDYVNCNMPPHGHPTTGEVGTNSFLFSVYHHPSYSLVHHKLLTTSFSNTPTVISPNEVKVQVLPSNISKSTSTAMLCQNQDRNSAAIMLSMHRYHPPISSPLISHIKTT